MENVTMIETLTGITLLVGLVSFGMVRAYRNHVKATKAAR